MKWSFWEEHWDDNYYLLEEYYNEHGNIDVPYLYRVNGVNLGTWLSSQRDAYSVIGNYRITSDHICLLNDLNIDWCRKDTKFLNEMITVNNQENYHEILLNRLNHVLNDMIYEGFDNEFDSKKSQKEVEDVIVKRLWR